MILLGAAVAALAMGAPAAGAANVLNLQEDESTGFSSIAPGTAIDGYLTQASLKSGKATEACEGQTYNQPGEMLKNHSTTDEIVYPYSGALLTPTEECSGNIKLQKTEPTDWLEFSFRTGAKSATKGATLSLKAALNTKGVYPTTFGASLEKPFLLVLEEGTDTSRRITCECTGVTLSGAHTPKGGAGIESAIVKGGFKRLTPEPTTCPKSVTLSLTWVLTVLSDSFNPYVYGFVEA